MCYVKVGISVLFDSERFCSFIIIAKDWRIGWRVGLSDKEGIGVSAQKS